MFDAKLVRSKNSAVVTDANISHLCKQKAGLFSDGLFGRRCSKIRLKLKNLLFLKCSYLQFLSSCFLHLLTHSNCRWWICEVTEWESTFSINKIECIYFSYLLDWQETKYELCPDLLFNWLKWTYISIISEGLS